MTPQYVFSMQGMSRHYPGGREVLADVNLSFLYGARIGVLGVNGAGKSTLLRIMAGLDQDFTGEARPAPGITIGHLAQEPALDDDKTVGEIVRASASEQYKILDAFNEVSEKLASVEDPDEMQRLIDKQAELQEAIDTGQFWDLESRLEMAMEALRCPLPEAKIATLSGGERRRVALSALLLKAPDLLLLDEPTNHLDALSVAWLERHLGQYPGTVVMVTHDRYFLDNVTGWILEIDRARAIPYEGNYAAWLTQKTTRLKTESKQEAALLKTLAREKDWVGSSPEARRSKSQARINAYQRLCEEAENTGDDREGQIVIPPGPRLGDLVLVADGLTKSFGGRVLFENLSFRLPPGGILGIIGANGTGKTSLLRLICDLETPDAGQVTVGETVVLGYADQSRTLPNGGKTVWEAVSDGEDRISVGRRSIPSRAFVAGFGFRGSDQQKPVASLSGGERHRVHMARTLKQGANLLLLDEPTNDLDVDTLRSLEHALLDFAGSAIIISHDRWFLDRIATHILAFEGDSSVCWFDGSYADYEEDRKKRLGDEALAPKRIKYRRLTRD